MVELTGKEKAIDRRGFLKGSALFAAAAVGVGMAGSAFASPQDAAKNDEKPSDEKDKDKEKTEEQKAAEKADQAKKDAPAKQGEQARSDPNKLVDKDGREYRVCERCGGNMYKEGNTWTCDQCGFSYVE